MATGKVTSPKSYLATEWKQLIRQTSGGPSLTAEIDLSGYKELIVELRQTYGSTHYYEQRAMFIPLLISGENRAMAAIVTSFQYGITYNFSTHILSVFSVQDPPDYSPYWRAIALS